MTRGKARKITTADTASVGDFAPGILPIPGHTNCYASPDGKIWQNDSRKLAEKRQVVGSHGYQTVTISGRPELVHRLILLTFVGPCPSGMEACHGPDPDKLNNRLGNLRWATRGDNNRDRMNHGWMPPRLRGSNHPRSKLDEPKVVEIRRLYASGYRSPTYLGAKYGVSRNTIKDVVSGRRWKHVKS